MKKIIVGKTERADSARDFSYDESTGVFDESSQGSVIRELSRLIENGECVLGDPFPCGVSWKESGDFEALSNFESSDLKFRIRLFDPPELDFLSGDEYRSRIYDQQRGIAFVVAVNERSEGFSFQEAQKIIKSAPFCTEFKMPERRKCTLKVEIDHCKMATPCKEGQDNSMPKFKIETVYGTVSIPFGEEKQDFLNAVNMVDQIKQDQNICSSVENEVTGCFVAQVELLGLDLPLFQPILQTSPKGYKKYNYRAPGASIFEGIEGEDDVRSIIGQLISKGICTPESEGRKEYRSFRVMKELCYATPGSCYKN